MEDSQSLFNKRGFPFLGLDDIFGKLSGDMTDGYVLARDKDGTFYLFVLEGKFYCSAFVGAGEGKRLGSVADFFTRYRQSAAADIAVFKADKKLLYCMLVKLNYRAAKTFTADKINLMDAFKDIDEGKKDAVVSLHAARDWGFALFIKGKAVYAHIPAKKEEAAPVIAAELRDGEHPLEKTLSYVYGLPADVSLVVEIYYDIKVSPAADTMAFPEEGVTAYYTKDKEAEAPVAPAGPYIEVIEDGIVKGTYPAVGEVSIGRDTTNEIRLAEAGVSRGHAVIKEKAGRYMLEDLKSANGTFFKGARVETKELHDGDEIHIRKYILRFNAPSAGKRAAPTAPSHIKEKPLTLEKAPQIRGASLIMADGAVHPLASITSIGKDEECDIKVEGMFVSKRHAVIVRGKDVFKLIKKGALSSIKVNGEKKDECVLKEGDVIEIGDHVMTFTSGKAGA